MIAAYIGMVAVVAVIVAVVLEDIRADQAASKNPAQLGQEPDGVTGGTQES